MESMAEESLNNTPQQRARRAFAALVEGDDTAIDLAQAALLIANEEYPDLDIMHYLAQLDALADRVRTQLDLSIPGILNQPLQETELFHALDVMNQVLFDQEDFRGNQKDYYNPCNSFLNDVLEKHIGIPISLSLIYMEVGRRLGIQLDGIGMPWHFIVRCR